MPEHARIGVLISGRGSNLGALLDSIDQQQLPGRVQLVLSNVADAAGLDYARNRQIEHCTLPHSSFTSRQHFDEALSQTLQQHRLDYVLLAGFMRILGEEFVAHWAGRLINIHPSLLPLYPGLDTHARALQAGDKTAGASVHFVTEQLDGGPVILQGKVDVEADDSPATLAARVLQVEHVIYPMALSWLLSGRATLSQNLYHLDNQVQALPPCWYQEQLLTPDHKA